MFRLKTAAVGGNKIRLPEVQDILIGWGHEISRAQTKKFFASVKNHFEDQMYFTGWENFSAQVQTRVGLVGTNKSWDIGMLDYQGEIANVRRMVNRPDKWFLFEKSFLDLVPTRGLEAFVGFGLDYFGKKKMASEDAIKLRENIFAGNDPREFHYLDIYRKGMKNGTNH